MDFAQKSLLGKARSRPDLVKQVLRKVQQEGPLPTYRTVTNRLDAPQPLGYSSAGVVEAVGAGVTAFSKGDRVACAGAGYANHAEWIVVPENLAVRVPEGVPLEQAAFATLGAIALQGIRVADPTLGETAAVVGLGLIGPAGGPAPSGQRLPRARYRRRCRARRASEGAGCRVGAHGRCRFRRVAARGDGPVPVRTLPWSQPLPTRRPRSS